MLTTEIEREITSELRKVRAPMKVARNLGVDIRHVLEIADRLSGTPRTKRQEQHGGYGRPELQDFVVARKRPWEPWNNALPEIAKARADYEAGTHDMATTRDGDWLILLSIPQRKKTPRPFYFRPEE